MASTMEFWGVEVKAGEPLKVEISDKILHLSQASLGETKKEKGNESIPLFLNIDGKKLVIGTLAPEKCPQITYDLVFEKDFELSHNWKHGSVYFCGYKATPEDDDDSDSEQGLPIDVKEFRKELKAKIAKENKEFEEDEEEDDDSEDSDTEDDESEEDGSDDDSKEISLSDKYLKAMVDDSDSDEEEDDSSDEEDEPTPKKVEQSKKRPADSATKTPTEKKAKLVTPQKTGGDKKGSSGHIATPHPAKHAGKTPANSDKSKQSPKSAASVSCGSCSKTFNSDKALESHSKAKHSAAK